MNPLRLYGLQPKPQRLPNLQEYCEKLSHRPVAFLTTTPRLTRSKSKCGQRVIALKNSAVNRMPTYFGCPIPIEMGRIKYLNTMVEQDQQTAKKRIRSLLGFESFVSASATLEGIEVANMIRKGQMTPGLCPFAQFSALAA